MPIQMKPGQFLLILSFIVVVFLFTPSCSRKKVLKNFPSDEWIADKNGCASQRYEMKDKLLSVKYRIRGLNYGEVEDILGKPDEEELMGRNQKTYVYYMQPGPDCNGFMAENKPVRLVIRFSAVGISQELFFENTI